jgi:AraC-like DNA-binding protein
LNDIRFKGTLYTVSEFTAPWGLRLDGNSHHVSFFMLLRGSCILQFDQSDERYSLAGGELIVSPRGVGCTLQDALGSPVLNIRDVCPPPNEGSSFLRIGGGGALTAMIMGCFQFDTVGNNPLVAGLPPVIYLKADQLQSEPWLENTLRSLAAETSQKRPGSEILVSRLTDILFIQTIRAFIGQIRNCEETVGWLKAIADPQIGQALSLIHERPEAPWTVSSLATAVGMSRTSFATKFTNLVTNTPIDYLTSWRMQKALRAMHDGEENLSEIALEVGYSSEAAFAKAFKREFGESPGAFRRHVLKVEEMQLA